MTLIKSISGIRGTIGGCIDQNLTPIDIVKFTTAYARLIAERKTAAGGDSSISKPLTIAVGRDARISGTMVQSIVEGTLIGCGVDVISLGLTTTPGVEIAVTHYEADGGIIITASHNAREWNALKLLNEKGEFLNAEEGDRVVQLSGEEEYDYPTIDQIGSLKMSADINPIHIEKVLSLAAVDVEAVRKCKFKVVVDAVNSVGGVVIPELLRELGCEVIELNCEPTGDFAHNPEPLAQNLTEIAAAIPMHKADLGVVVDPDVDRLALVCEDGEMFGEEYTLVAVSDYILSLQKGATVSNLSSSRALRDVTQSHGCVYYASAVGEVNVVAQMKDCDAIIGGEGNGGVIYPEIHYGRDALVGVALFLTLLAKKKCSVSELRKSYPVYFASKKKFDLTPEMDVEALYAEIKDRYKSEQITDIDGVKIDFADSWVHLRKSNTELIVRIYAEAHTQEEADALADGFINEMKSICNIE